MDYFTPKFTLGMTATPDKRDDNVEGRNIYEIFNHQMEMKDFDYEEEMRALAAFFNGEKSDMSEVRQRLEFPI